MRYDFDNNGTFEGIRTVTYDSIGRVVGSAYTYTDDGTPDTDFRSFTIGASNLNSTSVYTYDSSGLLSGLILDDANTRVENVVNYGSDGLVATGQTIIFDKILSAEAVFNSVATNAEGIPQSIQRFQGSSPRDVIAFEYDTAGRVALKRVSNASSTGPTETVYVWSSDGRLVEEITTVVGLPVFEIRVNYDYDSMGRLQSRLSTTLSNSMSISGKYRWRYSYDATSARMEVDLNDDGTVEAVVLTEFETALCKDVIFWIPGAEPNFTPGSFPPFVPGTGYALASICRNPV